MSWAIWITGAPGSGKTTLAIAVRERLSRRGVSAVVLDPLELTRPSPCEIDTHAVIQAARRLNESGVPVLIDGAAPGAHVPALARELLEDFAHVELVCPPDVCRTRERAVRWNIVPHPAGTCVAPGPDLGLGYEPARRPDLVLYTDAVNVWTAVDEVLRLVDRLERSARQRRCSCA